MTSAFKGWLGSSVQFSRSVVVRKEAEKGTREGGPRDRGEEYGAMDPKRQF